MGKTPRLVRLDNLLVKRGLATDKRHAQELIQQARVSVDGLIATQRDMRVRPDRPLRLVDTEHQWVGRGALKLLSAFTHFPTIQPQGKICADFGSSTGGFTEVLLKAGAQRIYAIDVGRAQLHWRLRSEPTIVVMEETNLRHLEALPEPIDLIVGDLSFISLKQIFPTVQRCLRPGGIALLLIKPQFEAPKELVSKGGLVRDEGVRNTVIQTVIADASQWGLQFICGHDCDVPGAKAGNVEYFAHFSNVSPSEK